MKIIVTRSTFINGVPIEASPTPVEVDKATGLQLIAIGKAYAVAEDATHPPQNAKAPPAPKSKDGDVIDPEGSAKTPSEADPKGDLKPKGKGK